MRITALLLVVLTATAGFCTSVNAAAKIFKWTDANGQVHFDSSPPPGQATEKVRIHKSVDAPPTTTPTVKATAANASAGTEKLVMSPQQREELATYCTAMRARLTAFKQGGLVIEKELDGTSVALDADAVAQKLSADEESVKTYCTANGL